MLNESALKGKAAVHWKSRRVCFYRCISAFSIFLSHTRRRRIMCGKLFILISAVLLLALSTGPAWADYEVLTGNYGSHDPVMTRQGDTYYSFCTGSKIPIRTSADMHNWATAGTVLSSIPSWVTTYVPAYSGTSVWAPDISYFNGKYHLYCSYSVFGQRTSAIGLVTNTTLDSSDPNYQWVDSGGPVIYTTNGSSYNAIDPALFIDTNSTPTTYWLAFGSFWEGIKMRQIDPNTGLLLASNLTLYQLAWNSSIEAAFIIYREPYYYLFVSFDICCREPYTYNIRVGRATSVTGPYYDRNGTSMNSSGGNRLTWDSESWRGPGHEAVFLDNDGSYWLVHHAYRRSDTWAALRIHELFWDSDGWPTLDDTAPVDVNEALVAWWKLDEGSGTTAVDSSVNDYNGTLTGGPTWITDDPCRVTDLSFDGTDDYIDIPDGLAGFDGVTISLWAYPTGVLDWAIFTDFGNSGPSNNIYFARSGMTTSLVFMVYNGTSDVGSVTTAAGAIELNKWQHFAVASDACGYTVIYKNGVPIKTGMTSPPWNVTRTINSIAKGNYYKGRLDDIRVYDKALDANDIKNIYGQGLASGTCLLVRSHGFGFAADWTEDCYVDFYDLAARANDWLNGFDVPDLADLAADWLQCNNPQDANCMPNW
jgi:arabinan endo-1,5-alpha-L-arabinosidase